jgi:hypothetical protein
MAFPGVSASCLGRILPFAWSANSAAANVRHPAAGLPDGSISDFRLFGELSRRPPDYKTLRAASPCRRAAFTLSVRLGRACSGFLGAK